MDFEMLSRMFSPSSPHHRGGEDSIDNELDSDLMVELIAKRNQQLGMMMIKQDMIRHLRDINNISQNDEQGCSDLSGSLGAFILETESSVANGTRPIDEFLNDNAFYIDIWGEAIETVSEGSSVSL